MKGTPASVGRLKEKHQRLASSKEVAAGMLLFVCGSNPHQILPSEELWDGELWATGACFKFRGSHKARLRSTTTQVVNMHIDIHTHSHTDLAWAFSPWLK